MIEQLSESPRRKLGVGMVVVFIAIALVAGIAVGFAVGNLTSGQVSTPATPPPTLPPNWPVNAHGQTYGTVDDLGPNGEHPDLVAVTDDAGKDGYAYSSDIFPSPSDSELNEPIPVYEQDGVTKIGVLHGSGG